MRYNTEGVTLASNETINGFILWYRVDWPLKDSGDLSIVRGSPDFEAHVRIVSIQAHESTGFTISHKIKSHKRMIPHESFKRIYRAWNTKIFGGIERILKSSLDDIPIYINEPHPYSNVALWRLNLPKTVLC